MHRALPDRELCLAREIAPAQIAASSAASATSVAADQREDAPIGVHHLACGGALLSARSAWPPLRSALPNPSTPEPFDIRLHGARRQWDPVAGSVHRHWRSIRGVHRSAGTDRCASPSTARRRQPHWPPIAPRREHARSTPLLDSTVAGRCTGPSPRLGTHPRGVGRNQPRRRQTATNIDAAGSATAPFHCSSTALGVDPSRKRAGRNVKAVRHADE